MHIDQELLDNARAIRDGSHCVLVPIYFDGKPTAAIGIPYTTPNGSKAIGMIAVMCTPVVSAHLTDEKGDACCPEHEPREVFVLRRDDLNP